MFRKSTQRQLVKFHRFRFLVLKTEIPHIRKLTGSFLSSSGQKEITAKEITANDRSIAAPFERVREDLSKWNEIEEKVSIGILWN